MGASRYATDDVQPDGRTIAPHRLRALRSLQGLINTDWGAVMLGTALAVLPLLIIFVLASRQVIEGLVARSVKG